MQNINLDQERLPYLGVILKTAIKTAFMRYFLDFTHVSQKEAYEQLQARIAFEQEIGNNGDEGDMTRKRSRPSTTNEIWAKQEIETRTAARVIALVHRLQFHFREASRLRKVCRIQRWYREWRKMIPVNGIEDITLYKGCGRTEGLDKRGLLRRAGIPITCAITQDAIPVKNSFKLVGPSGVVYAYTCSELIRYVRSTHKFECPATRNQLGLADVRRLQRRATKLNVNSGKSLVKEYEDRENTHNEAVENGYALTGLESSATEMFDRAVHMCERRSITEEDLLLRLEGDILPEWREYVRTLADMDTEACLAMLRTEKTRVDNLMQSGHVEYYAGYLHLQDQLNEYINFCSLRLRNRQMRSRFVNNNRHQQAFTDNIIETIIGTGQMNMNLDTAQWFQHRANGVTASSLLTMALLAPITVGQQQQRSSLPPPPGFESVNPPVQRTPPPLLPLTQVLAPPAPLRRSRRVRTLNTNTSSRI